jgi:predicted nucleic acid-binding protein
LILIDTTIVVQLLRSRDAGLAALLKTNDAAICGVTRAEVLHGARGSAERSAFIAARDGLQQVEIPYVLWDQVGEYLAVLRSAGFTVPLADMVIAALAIHQNVELWSRDQRFQMIQGILPVLKLFQAPP